MKKTFLIKTLLLVLTTSFISSFSFADGINSANYAIPLNVVNAGGSVGKGSSHYTISEVISCFAHSNKTNSLESAGSLEESKYQLKGGYYDNTESSVWYLAEGNTVIFDTYVLVQNPNKSAAEVKFTFMDGDGNIKQLTETIEGTKRYTVHVNKVMPDVDVSTKVESLNEVPVRVERAMYWNSGGLSWCGGHNSIGITEAATAWYLAEGNTTIFDTYVLIQNPDTSAAQVQIIFMDQFGNTVVQEKTIKAQSRNTIHVNKVAGMEERDVSTTVNVTNGVGVIVERAMYWNSGNYTWIGGHDSIAVTAPAKNWYLAEGNTGMFDMYVMLMNPGAAVAEVTVTFMDPAGNIAVEKRILASQQRDTIHVNLVSGMDNRDVSTSVKADQPIIVERSMYWDSAELKWAGGHASVGVTAPAKNWYLAEGNTTIFDMYVLLQNPGQETATISVTFMDADGNNVMVEKVLAGQQRDTIHVNKVSGMESRDVSTKVEADQPINVERAMYWDSGDYSWVGGHDSRGIK